MQAHDHVHHEHLDLLHVLSVSGRVTSAIMEEPFCSVLKFSYMVNIIVFFSAAVIKHSDKKVT